MGREGESAPIHPFLVGETTLSCLLKACLTFWNSTHAHIRYNVLALCHLDVMDLDDAFPQDGL